MSHLKPAREPGRYFRCVECGTLTPEVAWERDDTEEGACAQCRDAGEDDGVGHIVHLRAITGPVDVDDEHYLRGLNMLEYDPAEDDVIPPLAPTYERGAEQTLPTIVEVEAALGSPFADTAHRCHEVCITLVKSGLVQGRVVRGFCDGVGGQHSWIVLDLDNMAALSHTATIMDPTLWSYRKDVTGIWYGTRADGWHNPKGAGRVWNAIPQPAHFGAGPHLLPEGLPEFHRTWLKFLRREVCGGGAFDLRWWMQLFSGRWRGSPTSPPSSPRAPRTSGSRPSSPST